jgi:Flp pilus assembly protein CpaB
MGSSMQAATTGTVAGAPANSSAGESAVQTATLAVLPHEAAVLALADLNATLRLTLRSPHETNHSQAEDPFVLDAPVVAHLAAAPAPVRAPAPASAPRKAPAGIQIIDGDQVR